MFSAARLCPDTWQMTFLAATTPCMIRFLLVQCRSMRAAANPLPTRACAKGSPVRLTVGRSILAILFTFHGWLLCVHAVTGRLWDPATTSRWIAAAFILAGFMWLRRSGRPQARGRRALVLWLLVAMLHAHAAVDSAESVPAAAIP